MVLGLCFLNVRCGLCTVIFNVVTIVFSYVYGMVLAIIYLVIIVISYSY